jgi:alkaline phosphatase D
MNKLHRRTFVLGGLATAGAVALTGHGAQAATPFPFKLGVASGEPDASSVVLWTRLAPTPADGWLRGFNTDGTTAGRLPRRP